MTISSKGLSVILVDENDRELGIEDKLAAHQGGGKLHRAFSIFILDDEDRILLQRRAKGKYHCPGLWSNSCCSHPQPGMSLLNSARQRLSVELGFTVPLVKLGTVQYRLPMENGLTEWELDHLWLGRYNGPVVPNPDEVENYKWIIFPELEVDRPKNADVFTPWFPEILPSLRDYLATL